MAIRVHPLVCRVKVIPQMENLCQVHVYCFDDANQPSHPLTPSSPALNLSQHQGLFQWVSCSHQMTKILEFQLQHLSFQRVKIDWFDLLAVQGTLRSLLQRYSMKASNSLAFCLLYSPALTSVHDHWEDHSLDSTDLGGQRNVSTFQQSGLP